ncbi:MAG: hypothetical protein NT154_46570, partial [Verrucomicrobia bacterium]|nr:hypothetical protein [Verrucomicrobiota bacterium]
FPNLVVSAINVPGGSGISSGQPILYSFTVGNIGSTNTMVGNWLDRAVISADTTLGNADDIPLGFFPHAGALDAGQSYTVTNTFMLPDGLSGDFYIIAQTDAGNAVNEFVFEEDNITVSTSTFHINVAPYPDLRIETLTVTGPDSSSTYNITWNLANRGNAPAPAGFYERFIVRNQTTGAILVDSEQAITSTLAANTSIPRSRSVVAAGAGNYQVQVLADSHNDLFEYDGVSHASAEANNLASANFQIVASYTITLQSSPAGAGNLLGAGSYPSGTPLTVTAVPNTNVYPFQFVNWTESGTFQSASSNYTFGVTRDRTLIATFTLPTFQINASNNPPAAGSVSGQGAFFYGTTNVLRAIANFGYQFANWTENGVTVGTAPLLSIVTTNNHFVVANYSEANTLHVVTTATSPTNLTSVAGAGTYTNGQTANISAPLWVTNPPTLYHFREFRLNGAQVGTSASFSKVLNTVDPTNLQYIAYYDGRSILPVITNVAVNYPVFVPATNNFRISFRFDRTMNTNITPLVIITNAGGLNPTVPTGGTWSSTVLSNDMFTPPPITFRAGMDGTNDVWVSLARDPAGGTMTPIKVIQLLVDATPPAFSQVLAIPATVLCTVTWKTDKNATSQVEYGTNLSYGTLSAFNGSLRTNQSVLLSGLKPLTLYHFRVRSKDYLGVEGVSGDFTFTTLADTTPPDTMLTGGPAEGQTACSLPVAFSWAGTDDVTAPGNLVFSYQMDSQAWSAFAATAAASFGALPDGSHTFKVVARDESGNLDPTPVVRNFRLNTLGPTLSAVGSAAGPGQCFVTWQTDLPTTSQVEFGLTTAYGSATAVVPALVTDHAVTVPDLIPGTNYHFRVKSRDQCNRETVSGDGIFSTGPAPDLQVTSITAPAAVWTGRAFDVAWAVTNASSAPASGSWRDRVYLCSSAQPCTTYLLGEFPYTVGLAATSSVTRVQSVTIDRAQVTDGNYYLTVVVDALNEIHEGLPGSPAETNNTGVSAQPVQVQLTPLPDLVVSQVVAPTNSVYGGQQISVKWVVCNFGQAFTDAPQWHDRVRLYSDPNRTTLVKDFGEFVNPSYLGTNECYEQTAVLVLPVGISGSHYLVVETDSRNEVFESNESNNRGQVTNGIPVIYVAPPFLHVSSVTVAPAPP